MKTALIRTSLLLALAFSLPAQAQQATISAEYRGGSDFINTTPSAGFCVQWPEQCSIRGVETVALPITYSKRTVRGAPDIRDRFYIHLPGRRSFTVTNDRSGESHELVFQITNVSQRVESANNGGVPVFTQSTGAGCIYQFTAGIPRRWARYLWRVRDPVSPVHCSSSSQVGSPGDVVQSVVNELGIVYQLTMPSPLKMKQGTYRGQLHYTIGPNADFDFGNGVTNLSSDTLTLNFELSVVHAFVIDFPANSDRVVLEPPGGWGQWLHRRQPPRRLYRDLPLRIWSSGPFTLHSLCEHAQGNQCAIRNLDNGHQVPVQVALTLPGGIQHNGQPVNRLAVPVDRASAIELESIEPVINRSGMLHFEAGAAAVAEMIGYPGSRYEGDVTVVFDADF